MSATHGAAQQLQVEVAAAHQRGGHGPTVRRSQDGSHGGPEEFPHPEITPFLSRRRPVPPAAARWGLCGVNTRQVEDVPAASPDPPIPPVPAVPPPPDPLSPGPHRPHRPHRPAVRGFCGCSRVGTLEQPQNPRTVVGGGAGWRFGPRDAEGGRAPRRRGEGPRRPHPPWRSGIPWSPCTPISAVIQGTAGNSRRRSTSSTTGVARRSRTGPGTSSDGDSVRSSR